MHCELIVPALFPAALPAALEARHPALELLLARGRRGDAESRTLEQWLHHAFEQPGAALAAGALAAEEPGDGWWARADPVHLRLLRDRAVVVPGEALQISADETDRFISTLNQHFSGSAAFHAVDARRWRVRLGTEKRFLEKPALEAAGRDVATSGGNEALLTEIQMLLHAHPVNEAREARGEPTVNSLWLWGAGRVPSAAQGPWRSVAAADPSALGLAQLAGMRRFALPASAEAWLEHLPENGRHLAVLDALRAPAALEQQAEYEEGLQMLEQRWFAPLLGALRDQRIGMVTVRVPDAVAGAGFEAIRGDLRRFWRRRRPLARYA